MKTVKKKATARRAAPGTVAKRIVAIRFDHHAPNITRAAQHERMRAAFKRAVNYVLAHAPDTRERALAVTKLEEAMFWANACIARQDVEEG